MKLLEDGLRRLRVTQMQLRAAAGAVTGGGVARPTPPF